jgi:hypothetical protein
LETRPPAIGHVGQVAHHLDVVGGARRVEGAQLDRRGGVGDVDDAQSAAAIGHVGQVAYHLDVERLPEPTGEDAALYRRGGVGDVDDAQSAAAIGHVGQVAYHLDVERLPARHVKVAQLDRRGGVGDVVDTQCSERLAEDRLLLSGHVGQVAHHLDGARLAPRVEGAQLDRRGGVGDVDNEQSGVPIGHVGQIAHHLDVFRLRRFEAANRDERTRSRAQDDRDTRERKCKRKGKPMH